MTLSLKNKKGLSDSLNPFAFISGKKVLISNLHPLNLLDTNSLEKAISPHKISECKHQTPAEILNRDLVALKEFLHFVEAEPYLTIEKTENYKRVAFRKVKRYKSIQ